MKTPDSQIPEASPAPKASSNNISSPAPLLSPIADLTRRVEQAIAMRPVNLTWTHDKTREPKLITVPDLVKTLDLIRWCGAPTYHFPSGSHYKRNGKIKTRWTEVKPGLSITRLAKRLKCHRAKATRLLQILMELELIEKTGNYSTDRHGNFYAIVREGERPSPPPISLRQAAAALPPRPPLPPRPDDMADPF
jgi:hypothetical protein